MAVALAQEKLYTEEDYYAIPEGVRVELVEGELIYNQAAPSTIHQTILSELHLAIGGYIKSKGGFCRVFPAPFSVKLFENRKTIVEPDISVICDRDKITEKGCSGAPDWIVEIVSPSNSGYDYVRKLNLYADAGVREYWIVDPIVEIISVYHLEEKNYRAAIYTFQDKIKAHIYDDLIIDFSEINDTLSI